MKRIEVKLSLPVVAPLLDVIMVVGDSLSTDLAASNTLAEVEAELVDCGLLVENWPWMGGGCVVGANYSPGLDGVWMGRPRRLEFG